MSSSDKKQAKDKKSTTRKAQVQVMSSDTTKSKLVGLYLGGIEVSEIAKKIGCHVETCRSVIKAYKAELAKLDNNILASLLRSKFFSVMNSHDIQASEYIDQFITIQKRRDGVADDADKADDVEVKLTKHLSVDYYNKELRAIGTDWSKANKEFVDFVDRMGVPGMQGVQENREPTQPAILLENPNMSSKDAKLAMKSSLRRQLRALDKKDEEKDA